MARRAYDILSIGDSTVDLFLMMHDATVQCALNRRDCLFCLRYADKIPVEEIHEVPAAGNAANNAVGSARLGLSTAIVTILGNDEYGHGILREFERNHVETPFVQTDRRQRTNYSVVLNFQGERTILIYHAPRTYRLPPLTPARIVYLTSMGKGWERIYPALRRYLSWSGAQLAFNPGTHQLRTSSEILRKFLRLTSILLLNREEGAHLTRRSVGTSPHTLMKGLRDLGPSTVVLTDGTAGSSVLSDRAAYTMASFPPPAVERTGAGDAFSTGFLAALLRGEDTRAALRWGSANATSVVQKIGPQAGLLRPKELQALLRRFARVQPRSL